MAPSAPARALALAAGLAVLAGCGPPPDIDDGTGPPPAPGSPTPGFPDPGFPPPTPGPPDGPGFGDDFAVDCAGSPDAAEILALLTASDQVAPDLDLAVTTGPLCAGSWQYAVVSAPDLDPVQVVTEGEPGSLELVVIGTDVCTPEVRIQAPRGIRTATGCG